MTNSTFRIQPRATACLDANADGWNDIAVVSLNDGLLRLFLNHGNGTFPQIPVIISDAVPQAVNLAIADVDGDGFDGTERGGGSVEYFFVLHFPFPAPLCSSFLFNRDCLWQSSLFSSSVRPNHHYHHYHSRFPFPRHCGGQHCERHGVLVCQHQQYWCFLF